MKVQRITRENKTKIYDMQ